MDPIMSLLPNDLIIRIIRKADGGRTSHERKLLPLLKDVIVEGSLVGGMWGLTRTTNISMDIDDLTAFNCDRRHHHDSDEAYMDVIRNPEEYC